MRVLVGVIALLLAAFMLWGIGALVRRKTGPQNGDWPEWPLVRACPQNARF